jgi:hypothetical protein
MIWVNFLHDVRRDRSVELLTHRHHEHTESRSARFFGSSSNGPAGLVAREQGEKPFERGETQTPEVEILKRRRTHVLL